jgi:predicted acyltransferase
LALHLKLLPAFMVPAKGGLVKMSDTSGNPQGRLAALDQFRGYTMVGMLLVNFLGSYKVCPQILKHTHDYCSYADTIMPQFLFAAGFAMQLSLGKRLQQGGRMPWGRAIRRILSLAVIAIVWYSFCDFSTIVQRFRTEETAVVLGTLFKRSLFQTLLHIAVTSLWILPVIGASPGVRMGYAAFSGLLHVVLSGWFNFLWVNSNPMGIDGGPLGFLTWSIPAICGTLACDLVRSKGANAARTLIGPGVGLMFVAWCWSCGSTLYNVPDEFVNEQKAVKLAEDSVLPSPERIQRWSGSIMEPPFVPPPNAEHRKWNYWMMSQRGGTISYTTFSAGFSLVVFALFLWACDSRKWQVGVFRTLGTNSLAAYLLHDVASWWISPWFPTSSGPIMAAFGFLCFSGFVYGVCCMMERRGWLIRV